MSKSKNKKSTVEVLLEMCKFLHDMGSLYGTLTEHVSKECGVEKSEVAGYVQMGARVGMFEVHHTWIGDDTRSDIAPFFTTLIDLTRQYRRIYERLYLYGEKKRGRKE